MLKNKWRKRKNDRMVQAFVYSHRLRPNERKRNDGINFIVREGSNDTKRFNQVNWIGLDEEEEEED